jgi:hypothetical protein
MATEVEIRRTLRTLIADLDRAIAFYETYVPTGQDINLIDRINKTDFYPAYNIISEALHINAILTLCRLWDSKKETASLCQLASKFCRSMDELSKAGHKIHPQKIDKWLRDVEAGNKSGELLALRRIRHRALAHRADPNNTYTGKARNAVYGDERKVLEMTIPLIIEAGSFIGIVDTVPVDKQRKIRQDHAQKFWDKI